MSIFSSVPTGKLARSTFDLSHEKKLSFNFGGLYPILTEQILPGDTWSLSVQNFIRTVPLLSPVMHRNDIKLDAFFVPFPLIWEDYEKAVMLGSDSVDINVPKLVPENTSDAGWSSIIGNGQLADHFGMVPITDLNGDKSLNALPYRAYHLIYNEYYRNQVLEDELSVPKFSSTVTLKTTATSSPYDDSYNSCKICYRSWRRDYFTSALPTPQKGSPVLLPESDLSLSLSASTQPRTFTTDGNNPSVGPVSIDADYNRVDSDGNQIQNNVRFFSTSKVVKTNQPTIEDFRYAETLQELYEAESRGGGRYKEWLLNIWHTLSPDLTLSRPAYLGGYRGPIQISEVPQTSQGTATSSQGTLAGKGSSVGGCTLFKKYHFRQPGILMVIMSIVPKSCYQQGTRRFFAYRDGFDFPNPFFANLGEQPIWKNEIYGNTGDSYGTFGYTPRYAECKYIPDMVSGELKSSLAYWHEGRIFSSEPSLNQNFVKMHPEEVSRIFPVLESSDKLIGEFFFNIKAKRNLPYYGVPRLHHHS